MQIIIRGAAWLMTVIMGASGAESLNVAASIFMGQTEAPLTIRPFLPKLTKSELMTVMTSGMAHISGGMMAAYMRVGGADAKHLLTAVIMTAPGTLLMAKMLVPETEQPLTAGRVEMRHGKRIQHPRRHRSRHGSTACTCAQRRRHAHHISCAARPCQRPSWGGAIYTSLVSLQPAASVWLGLAPIAWLIGIPWHDAPTIGNLLGTRMVLNEFVAFAQLGTMKDSLDPRSFTIATFALCGFANFSSIGIQIGGIGALAPEQRSQLANSVCAPC